MTPGDFIKKWHGSTLSESEGYQVHFTDLCRLLGEPAPYEPGTDPDAYGYQKGAIKTTGAKGWADVWKRGHFGWEYKGPGKNLQEAYAQLQRYAPALDNPPLLVVATWDEIRVHTNWTNTVQEVHAIRLPELADPDRRRLLKWAFAEPERLRPGKTRQALTEEAAGKFAALATRLRGRGHDPHTVAHFLNRLVFCMFAEDVDLLPAKMFARMLQAALAVPDQFAALAADLFRAMKDGGRIGFEMVAWFNGGLFDDDSALPLDADDLKIVLDAARLDWSDIDPSILGTLFERGLDPGKRSQLGAHYTDRDKIMKIVEPVIVRPLEAEWAAAKAEIDDAVAEREAAKDEIAKLQKSAQDLLADDPAAARRTEGERRNRQTALRARATRAQDRAQARYDAFLERLAGVRVLDPACGSGNFLYLALLALKDLEHRANLDAEAVELARRPPRLGPECVKGIEINPYAAELARVSVWIGEIQWMQRNGFGVARTPILRPLDTIECRDALLNPDGTEAEWPAAEFIIGNPPFLGAKLMKSRLGKRETECIRAVFQDRLPGFTDLVCYWFEKARDLIARGVSRRAGLVATNSIRKNTNLPVLDRISDDLIIFEAISEEQWTVEGSNVDVSIVCFGDRKDVNLPYRLDGQPVRHINVDLTTGVNLTLAKKLRQNLGASFLGIQKSGPFDVSGQLARQWLQLPQNPNRQLNSDVLKPYWNGDDATSRPRDYWFIDLPRSLSIDEASAFEAPFAHLSTAPYDPTEDPRPRPRVRAEARDKHARQQWWEPYWPRPGMRKSIERLRRYIVTPETAEHRLFVWLSYPVLPDKNLIVVGRDDDTTLGVLQSRFHQTWALRKGSDLEDRPRYTSTSTFATFPFPDGLTPDIPAADYALDPRAQAIAAARRHGGTAARRHGGTAARRHGGTAARLNELREAWLNPADLVRRVPEVVPGFPDRLLPVSDEAAKILKKRTLTNLYNERPAWLAEAHRALDEAVAAAYGWPADLADEDVLARLLELNLARAAAEGASSAGPARRRLTRRPARTSDSRDAVA